MIKARRSKNAVNADFQPVVCVVIALLFSAEKPIAAIQSCNSASFNKIYIFITFPVFIFWQKPHVRLNFPSKSVYLNAYQRNISFWISTVTQRLDQINSSIASNNTTTPENIRSDLLISAFEQSEIHNTLEHTRLKSTQLTHIPNLEKIPAS